MSMGVNLTRRDDVPLLIQGPDTWRVE